MNGLFYRLKTDLESRPFLAYIFHGGMMKRSFRWIVLAFMPVSAIAAGATGIPLIHDDFLKARSQALQRKLPLFVECWAPW
jgi:hypothetical protein